MEKKSTSVVIVAGIIGLLVGLALAKIIPGSSDRWLDALVGFSSFFLVVATAALVIVAWRQAHASYIAVEEMKRQGAPAVVLFFRLNPDDPDNIDIVLKNFGLRPAYDVEITSSPALEYDRREARAFPDNGVKFLAPGQSIQMLYCQTFVDLDYDVTTTWGDGLTGRRVGVHQPLSLRHFVHDEVTTC